MQAGAEDNSAGLEEYDESTDDAVTRIYDGEEPDKDGASQPQAWMHDSRPPESARSGWSRWAVVTLLGVLVAVASGAAFMASRSVARTPVPTPEAKAAAAAVNVEAKRPKEIVEAPAAAAKGAEAQPGAAGPERGLASVSGQEPASDNDAPNPTKLAASAVDDGESSDDEATERRGGRKPTLKRVAAAPRRARSPEPRATPPKASEPSSASEPATVAAVDLPVASEPAPAETEPREPEPVREPAPVRPAAVAPRPAAADKGADGDLVIEEEAPKVAFLTVDATPYATVFIDGEKKGITPLVRLELSPGLHRMIARTEDGRTKRFTLQLDPGKTETVKVSWEE
jgi:hypothetical protein